MMVTHGQSRVREGVHRSAQMAHMLTMKTADSFLRLIGQRYLHMLKAFIMTGYNYLVLTLIVLKFYSLPTCRSARFRHLAPKSICYGHINDIVAIKVNTHDNWMYQ